MVYSFARVSAVVGMRVEDYYQQGKRWWLRPPGKRRQAPRRPDAGRRGLLPDGDLEHLARVDDAR